MKQVVAAAVTLNEGIRVQEVRSCLLCASEGTPFYRNVRDRLFRVPGTWSVSRCPKCQFVWLDPQPILEDIGKLYAEDYASHAPPSKPPGRFARFWKTVKHSVMAASLGYKAEANGGLGRLLSRFGVFREVGRGAGMWLEGTQRGRLLDVGCGAGQFLSQMAKFGWDVVGVEPDRDAVKVARETFGLDVREGTLEEASFSSDSFDAVALHHVIEHVHDPVGLLKACSSVLRPGGRLVVVTPNVESLAHRWFRVAWFSLQPPQHLLLWSESTLRECARKAGVQVQGVHTSARTAGGIWYMSRLLEKHGKLPGLSLSPQNPSIGLLLQGALFWMVEHLYVKVRPCGEEIVMICSK